MGDLNRYEREMSKRIASETGIPLKEVKEVLEPHIEVAAEYIKRGQNARSGGNRRTHRRRR